MQTTLNEKILFFFLFIPHRTHKFNKGLPAGKKALAVVLDFFLSLLRGVVTHLGLMWTTAGRSVLCTPINETRLSMSYLDTYKLLGSKSWDQNKKEKSLDFVNSIL